MRGFHLGGVGIIAPENIIENLAANSLVIVGFTITVASGGVKSTEITIDRIQSTIVCPLFEIYTRTKKDTRELKYRWSLLELS